MAVTPEFNKFEWNRHPDRVALRGAAGALASVMFNRADMDGSNVWGAQEQLSRELCVSVRTVRRAQRDLESQGLIRLVSKGSSYGNTSNRYVLTMPKSSPDIFPEADRTSINLTGHSCPTSPDTSVLLIDPLPDPLKGSGVSNYGRTSEMSAQGVDPTSVLGTDSGTPIHQPTTESVLPSDAHIGVPNRGTPLGGHPHSHQPAESEAPMSYNPADPFASPPNGMSFHPDPFAAVPASGDPPTCGDEWAQPATSAEGVPEYIQHPHRVPWPRNVPIPVDPWCQFVDNQTGELFDYTPGELPRVSNR